MKKHDDNLDRLVTELIRTTILRDDEQDAIASRSDLFSSVRARIIADDVIKIERTSTVTFFQRSAILTAAAAVIVVAVFGTMLIGKRPITRPVVNSIPPVPQNDKFAAKDSELDRFSFPPITDESEIKQPTTRAVRAVEYRPIVSERRTPVQREPQFEEQPPRFFALAGLRPSEVAVDGSRIIRVELPRASLVALGVNVALDSDKQLIKTDLLVGPDGVPRAIRLVE